MIKDYKKPGISLPKDESREIIKLFRLKYLGTADLPNWKGNKIPAWCQFKKELEARDAAIEILNEDHF